MPAYRAQVTLQGDSGSPKDRYVNNWCIDTTAVPSAGEWADLADAFEDFWIALAPGAGSILFTYLGRQLAQNNHTVKFYELETAPPHLPLFSSVFNFASDPAPTSFPAEVACCLSLMGPDVPGTFQGPGPHMPARNRGRVYIGPLSTACGTYDQNDIRPSNAFADDLLFAVQKLNSDIAAAAAGPGLSIWSSVNQAAVPVNNAYVDNAFDIQRRRGAQPTARRGPVAA